MQNGDVLRRVLNMKQF